MKEQNAAHSFEKLSRQGYFSLIGASPYNATAATIWDTFEHHSYVVIKDSELTRLRSELQQEREKQFNLPDAAVFNLQQIALADDDMVKVPGAAEQYRFIARHILELFQKSKAK